jgi:adenylate cyclase
MAELASTPTVSSRIRAEPPPPQPGLALGEDLKPPPVRLDRAGLARYRVPQADREADIADIFISYAREDQAVARLYAEAFEAQGFSVWWDAALRSGEAFDEAIEAALRAAKAVVVLWSPRSVASRWVRAEATMADRNKTLAPVIIEPCERPIMFELTQTADLSHWSGASDDPDWLSLLAEVRRFVGVRESPQPEAPAAAPRTATDARPSILVLPLINMSGDVEQEYFSDGVSEDIITDLGRVSALSVVSRNTAFSYKGKTIAPRHLAATLGISHVLEGSVRKSGARVRITAQLTDATHDTQVWAERFDRNLDDIFAIQEEISRAIVGALKVRLAPAEKEALERRPTANAEAYELYLLARQFDRTGSERLKPLIVRICERALTLDPDFGQAWVRIAFAEAEAAQRGVPGASQERAFHAAQRAVAVAPNLAEAHAAMAEVLIRGALDLAAAEPFIETALRLDPDCYDAHLCAGYLYLAQRRWEDSRRHFEAAAALEPSAFRPTGMVCQVYEALGDRENTLAAARRARDRSEKLLAVEPDHGGALGYLVTALALLGENERAHEWARRAVLFDPENLRLHYNLACCMVTLGDTQAACDLLDGIIDKVSEGWLRWLSADNDLDPIRDDPRFIAIMARGAARFSGATPTPASDKPLVNT